MTLCVTRRPYVAASLRHAFTLVELLVVISIIGILMALILPAVQSAREAGRRTQCRNNLRNMAAAALQHTTMHGFYPTGGWGYRWLGDPDLGFTRKQPGGWQYNILPYMEEATLHDRGKGESFTNRRAAATERIKTPIAMFNCPTRRRAELLPCRETFHNAGSPGVAVKSDYAANLGSLAYTTGNTGPGTNAIDANGFPNQTDAQLDSGCNQQALRQNGPINARSQIKPAHILDGASKTYLLGERHIPFNRYETGQLADDDQGWGVGIDRDVARVTFYNPNNLGSTAVKFDQDATNFESTFFGSAHIANFGMAMCDGSVKGIPYEIDPFVHMSLGDRAGGDKDNLSDLSD